MKITAIDAIRALGLEEKGRLRLRRSYTDDELLEVMRATTEANGPQSFRMLFRTHAPGMFGRDEDIYMRKAIVRLADAGLVTYQARTGVGRPTFKWFLTDEGRERVDAMLASRMQA